MEFKVTNNVLQADIPLGKGILSRSGKNLTVATTNGFVDVEGTEYKISLNVIKKR